MISVVACVGMLSACGGNAATEAPLPDAVTLFQSAADEIQQIASLRFKLQLTGAPAFVDTANVISFISADGSYAAPDRVAAVVKAEVLGLSSQIDIVAIGDKQYWKHEVLTARKWIDQPFSPGFNADKLIRSEDGIKKALRSMRDVKMVGKIDRFGVQVYHITGKANTADISALTVGLIRGTGEATVDAYMRVDTGRVDTLVLVQPETITPQTPNPTTWTLELFDYAAADIVITPPPDVAATGGSGGLAPGVIPNTGTVEATAEATAQPTAQASQEAK
jgi:hypothetical protein